MATLSKAQYDAEVARKKSLGIPLNHGVPTPPNANTVAKTNSATPVVPKANPVPTPSGNNFLQNMAAMIPKGTAELSKPIDPKTAASNAAFFKANSIPTPKPSNSQASPPQPTIQAPVSQPVKSSIPAPTTNAVTNVRNESELKQSAGDELAIERAALLRAATEKLSSLRNNADYANQLIADQRTLENASFQRNSNPFSGKTSYDAAMLGRGRQIDDNQRMGELNNQMDAVSQELYDFDKLSPERQRQIYNQLLEMERNFGLNVGQLTGTYGNQRTLAGQQFDHGKEMDYADRLGTLGGQRTLAGINSDRSYEQQQWQNRFDYGNAIGQFSNGQQTMQNRMWQEDTRRNNRDYDRGVFESDRNYDRGVFENDRAYDRGVYEDNRDYGRGVYENNRSYNRGAESDRRAMDNEAFDQFNTIWQRTGEAPFDFKLPNGYVVKAGTKYTGQFDGGGGGSGANIDPKTSVNNYNDILADFNDANITKGEAFQLLQANSSYLTDSDYKRLNDWINENL